jgi:hypothetical protein
MSSSSLLGTVEDKAVIITVGILQLTITIDQYVVWYSSMTSSQFIIGMLHVQIHYTERKRNEK